MIECTRFKSVTKGHLLGFADFWIPKWGVELNGCSLYQKDGKRWLNMPAQEYTNEAGEKKYRAHVYFREKAHMDAFQDQAKRAIDEWCTNNAKTES